MSVNAALCILLGAVAVRIEPFLLDDEALLGSCGTGRGLVCATDLRLLKVEHTPFGRRIRDLSYREISSVTIADHADGSLIGAGLLAVAIGYLLPRVAPLLLALLDRGRGLRFTADGTQSILMAGIALIALGLLLVAFGAGRRRTYVGLEGPFLLRSRRQRQQWRFAAPTASDARVFAGLVRGRLADRQPIDGRKVLPHDAL
jgi:hypothetical protein